jgi:hypothetical protein
MVNESNPDPHVAASRPKMTYAVFLEERKAKVELEDSQAQFIDQWLLTLSGGALGLMLTFLHDYPPPLIPWWAKGGMISLVACMAIVLLSLDFSQRSIRKHITALDEWCDASFAHNHASQKAVQRNWWAGATGYLNLIAMVLCIAGISILSIFVGSNLQ